MSSKYTYHSRHLSPNHRPMDCHHNDWISFVSVLQGTPQIFCKNGIQKPNSDILMPLSSSPSNFVVICMGMGFPRNHLPVETPCIPAEEARRSIPRNTVHKHTSASSLEAFTRVRDRTMQSRSCIHHLSATSSSNRPNRPFLQHRRQWSPSVDVGSIWPRLWHVHLGL